MYDVQSSADEAMVKGGEREEKENNGKNHSLTAAWRTRFCAQSGREIYMEMELSQRPRGGYFALTAAERRKNGNIYVNGAILAEKKLLIYQSVGAAESRKCLLTDSRLQQYAAKRRGEKANYTTAE